MRRRVAGAHHPATEQAAIPSVVAASHSRRECGVGMIRVNGSVANPLGHDNALSKLRPAAQDGERKQA